MQERQIEELLAHVALPPAPDSLKQRVFQPAGSRRLREVVSAQLTWVRAVEAAATFAMLAGAAGSAY